MSLGLCKSLSRAKLNQDFLHCPYKMILVLFDVTIVYWFNAFRQKLSENTVSSINKI